MDNKKQMDNKKKVLLTGAALVALSSVAAHQAQAAGTTTAITAHAQIVEAISLSATATLEFGTFSDTAGLGGNYVIAPTGADTIPGAFNFTPGSAATAAGGFTLKASPVAVSLSVPAADTVTNGTANMVLNAFNLVTDAGGTAHVVTNPTATLTVAYPVGATLVVGAAQAAGDYTGSFVLTAGYQ